MIRWCTSEAAIAGWVKGNRLGSPERLIEVRLALCVAVVVVLAAACGSEDNPGSAPLPESISVEELIEQFGVTPAALEDIRFIAGEEGWSLEEALYRVAWQEGFSIFAQELRETYPEEFASAEILGDEGPRRVLLAFRGLVPEEVRSDPRLEHLDIEFREMTGFSEAELADQVIAVHYTMRNLGFIEVGTGPDPDTGEVRVDAARRPEDRGKTDGEIIATFPENLRADNVVIVFYPEGTVLGADDE